MQMTDVDDFAGIMLDSYDETATLARAFFTEQDWPMTVLAKAQVFRSFVQSRVVKDDRYALDPLYASMGRVLVTDAIIGSDLLVRSQNALQIESELAEPTLDLAVKRALSGVKLLVYKFDQGGLSLSWCESYAKNGGRRLLPDGQPEQIGYWPSTSISKEGTGEFDQGAGTNWDQVGDISDDTGTDA
ncbi:hypothetical protein [Rhodococcus erythropolis]|uniref:Uncharacterized protein n=1 Tax=Rhodococcus erythropolis TaxID=1833 RepID=A0A8I1A3E4_RHOER|nr:hypothetical protein [Rhodococcus erythropolis]MBH5145340.1 hypothetical protein [Rhodococcus erythropolis]